MSPTSLATTLQRRVINLGAMGLFLGQVLRRLPHRAARAGTLAGLVVAIGSRSMGLMIVAGGFVGAMLAVQFFDTLSRFGSPSMLGAAVGLGLIRELGPVLAALIVLGRAGSALAAEVASMRGSQQLDALACMAIDPLAYLMVPRLIACLISLPLLTAIFDVAGLLGGMCIGALSFGSSAGIFLDSAASGIGPADVRMGFVKSVVFAALIGWICLGKGFLAPAVRGTEDVSRVSADAVVIASMSILGADYLLSALMS